MEYKYIARTRLNKDYKQIMSAFSAICTQLEFGEVSNKEKIPLFASYYTLVFLKAGDIPPIVYAIDAYLAKNPEFALDENDLDLAAEIITENHIHELKTEGLITIKQSSSGVYEIFLTEKGKSDSKAQGKDIRLI
jgi:hypothetical protein